MSIEMIVGIWCGLVGLFALFGSGAGPKRVFKSLALATITVAVPMALFFGGITIYSKHQAAERARQEEAWQKKQALRQEKREAGEQLAESECSKQYDAQRDSKLRTFTRKTAPWFFCKRDFEKAHDSCLADDSYTVEQHLLCMSNHVSPTTYQKDGQTDALPQSSLGNYGVQWQEYQVRNGENLTDIFKNLGLTTITLYKVLDGDTKNNLARLKPGMRIKLLIDKGNILQQLNVRLNIKQTLVLTRVGDRYHESILSD